MHALYHLLPTFAVVAVELLERDIEGGRGDTGYGAAPLVGGLSGSQCVLALVKLGPHASCPKTKKYPINIYNVKFIRMISLPILNFFDPFLP